jgi:hypothetical protein
VNVGSGFLYWVVQRNTHTGDLITFRSFADYESALWHKVELNEAAQPIDDVSVVAIESLPVGEFPR